MRSNPLTELLIGTEMLGLVMLTGRSESDNGTPEPAILANRRLRRFSAFPLTADVMACN